MTPVTHFIRLRLAHDSRNNLRMRLAKPGIECVLNGLYMTRANQLDHHMIVDHAAPHCDSHEYFNGILNDQSRGVPDGRTVQPVAQNRRQADEQKPDPQRQRHRQHQAAA